MAVERVAAGKAMARWAEAVREVEALEVAERAGEELVVGALVVGA